MIGKRVECIPQQGGFQKLNPGEYMKYTDGTWHACTPNDKGANLSAHQVVEHEDGTITVTPSIEVKMRAPDCTADRYENIRWIQLYHGHLERGVWRNA